MFSEKLGLREKETALLRGRGPILIGQKKRCRGQTCQCRSAVVAQGSRHFPGMGTPLAVSQGRNMGGTKEEGLEREACHHEDRDHQ